MESTRKVGKGHTPVADRIRAARGRFHANHTIAAYIHEGELEQLQLEVGSRNCERWRD